MAGQRDDERGVLHVGGNRVATRPKNTKTNSSPNPRYPYGRGPPVRAHPAMPHTRPRGISHHVTRAASPRPARPAIPKARSAAS